MPAIAILVGSSEYVHLNPLPCCRTDVEAVAALINGLDRFGVPFQLLDLDSTELKRQIRAILETTQNATEIFFYFSGHGHSHEGEFYFCPRDFSEKRPNETGLSNSELTSLLRECTPELVVKVVDACSSGALLIKSGGNFLHEEKGALKNLIQIASCLDSQTSLCGELISEFTEKFCIAATRQTEGPIYYTDIISILRDEYIDNQLRSPHFVLQASAREVFVENSSQLHEFREKFNNKWATKPAGSSDLIPSTDTAEPPIVPSLLDVLSHYEDKVAHPVDIPKLVGDLFDGIKHRLDGSDFSKYFTLNYVEYSDFRDNAASGHIARVLSHEKRQDEFVTATVKRQRKMPFGLSNFASNLALGLAADEEVKEIVDLNLNIKMERAQLLISLTPKFLILQKIILIVSCAPSLENCYVFELAKIYPRTDWSSYSSEGQELTRKWYKLSWREDIDWLADKIAGNIEAAVTEHVEKAAERLSK